MYLPVTRILIGGIGPTVERSDINEDGLTADTNL